MIGLDDGDLVLAVSVDGAYADAAAVAIASVVTNLRDPERLRLWLLHAGLDAARLQPIARLLARAGARLEVVELTEAALNLPLRSDYISAATFGRLYLGDILPTSLSRVLYLDCDTLVMTDVADLWRTDLEGRIVGAVPEASRPSSGRPRTYEHPLDPCLDPAVPYFNAGVLLIDLVRWRNETIGRRAIAYVERCRPPLMDQDALNAVVNGRWRALDRAWNVTTFWFRSPTRQRTYRTLLRRAHIIHYVGHRKPWLRDDVWLADRWRAQLEALASTAGLDAPPPGPGGVPSALP